MATTRIAALGGLLIIGLSGLARAGELDSSRWRWATWSQNDSVASLRWGNIPSSDPTASQSSTPRLSILAPTPSAPVVPPILPPATLALIGTPIPQASAAPPVFILPGDARVAAKLPPANSGWILRPTQAATASASRPSYDASINMSNSGFSSAPGLTTGGAAPWYLSPVVQQLYSGIPTSDQQAEFTQDVLSRVESSFTRSGLGVSLTSDPGASAAHTMSVVSGTQNPASPDAVGVTQVGRDGFTFIDKLLYAASIDDLKWAVAHNLAHELMHAFGVDRHDPTGGYLDSAVTDWSTLTDPNALFSPDAIRELAQRDFKQVGTLTTIGAQHVDHGAECSHCLGRFAAPVPEPATWMAWGLGLLAVLALHQRRRLTIA